MFSFQGSTVHVLKKLYFLFSVLAIEPRGIENPGVFVQAEGEVYGDGMSHWKTDNVLECLLVLQPSTTWKFKYDTDVLSPTSLVLLI